MSAIEESLKIISERVKDNKDSMMSEEAVKTAVILPFLRALGYDVFNPREVIPEFTADAVGKKGEKVDYAICIEDKIRILFECKPISFELNTKHLSQLYRYFSVTDAKFAILTNGRLFQFYTDLGEQNKLDTRPFLTFDITEYNSAIINELKKFERSAFDVNNILATAERLKYVSGIKQNILQEIENPSEAMVRLVCNGVFEKRISATILEMLTNVTKSAFREVISDAVKNRLSTALQTTDQADKDAPEIPTIPESGIVTTDEEIEAFMIVKAIARQVIDVNRVTLRDAKSYCSIFIDDNNRKPLLRLHFNRTVKQIELFIDETTTKNDIQSLDEIYNYSEEIKATIGKYL